MEQEKIKEKLKKLLAHKESAESIGSVAEAEAFAARISALLAEYKLEMSDLQTSNTEEEEINQDFVDLDALGIGFTQRRDTLMVVLADIVGKANFCMVICNSKGNGFRFVGKTTDRQVALYIFHTLYRFSREEAEKRYREQYYQNKLRGTEYLMKGFKKSFLHGFNTAIRERLQKETNRQQLEYSGTQALALRNAHVEVAKWVNKSIGKLRKSSSSLNANNSNARNQGYEYGKSVSMNSGLSSGSGNNRRLN